MTNLTKEVHGFFEEEKLMHESSDTEYYDNQRKCYKYHYTTIGGLKGILTNRTLWLMHSNGLNDLSEGKLILQETKKKLNAINLELLDRFENSISAKLENFYSCSFSSYGNLLSQWRGYGDIAVGFDWDSLQFSQGTKKIIDDSGEQLTTSGLVFVPCDYIDPSDEAAYEPFIKNAVKQFRNTFSNPEPSLHEIHYCALTIGANTTSVKHIGFFEEKEYRIVHYCWNVKGTQDHATKKLRVEYKFHESSVKRIVIGPCKDQKKKLCSVKRILEGLRPAYNNVEVYRSMIPFIK